MDAVQLIDALTSSLNVDVMFKVNTGANMVFKEATGKESPFEHSSLVTITFGENTYRISNGFSTVEIERYDSPHLANLLKEVEPFIKMSPEDFSTVNDLYHGDMESRYRS